MNNQEKEIVYSRDGEVFYHNEDIIDEAIDEDCGYYTGEKHNIDVGNLVSNSAVDVIIDHMNDALYDIVGEVSIDALSITKEKQTELQKIIRQFMKENCSCSCWSVDNVQYHPLADIPHEVE